MEREIEELINKVIGCCVKVHKDLGPGFDKKLYCHALENYFREERISFEAEKEISVHHHDIFVGTHCLDFMIEEKLLLEVEAIEKINKKEYARVRAHLRAMDKEIGLLVNFAGFKVDVRRIEQMTDVR